MNDNEFKVLEEKTIQNDQFKEKTHEKVAETLYKLITKNSDSGLTIGLEGSWGSGKSTVISILKDKLEILDDTKYFYFDAWAHEGDPLRRVFLESLIEQVDPENEKLKEIENKVTNRIKKTTIETKQQITGLGKILAISSFFVPFGIAVTSGLISKNGFLIDSELTFSFELVFSMVLCFAPVLVLGGNLVKLFIQKIRKKTNKILDINNWMFLQSEAEQTKKQEVSDEDERSSIEFEKYFNEILTIIFDSNDIKRLLIVVDNLDRIDPQDTLKIWSTLQTFLQERNPSGKIRSNYDKIWIIVPYDSDGLKKVWENHNRDNENQIEDTETQIKNNSAKSFFDKCFQLRLEVPRLLMSGWESFCQMCMDDSLLNWTKGEKKAALNILRWTRDGVLDSPSPREIKTFVNQIGILRIHSFDEILTESIAYFTIEKYLKLMSNKKIQDSLLNGELPEEKLTSLLDPNIIRADFSSLIFGVQPKKAVQILLESKIEKALKESKIEELEELVEIHQSAFWTVFDLHIMKIDNPVVIIDYCHTIYKSIAENKECSVFHKFVNSTIKNWDQLVFPSSESLEKYKSLFLLVDKFNGPIKELSDLISNSFVQEINKEESSNIEYQVEALIDLIAVLDDSTQIQIHEEAFNYETWIILIKEIDKYEYNFTKNIKLPASLIDEIASRITAGNEIPEEFPLLVQMLKKSGYENWEDAIDSIGGHVDWNSGNTQPIFSVRVFEIIQELININDDINIKLREVVKMGTFWNLVNGLKPKGSIKIASLILARLLPEKLDDLVVPNVVQSQTALDDVRVFWNTTDEENSEFVWETITNYSDYGFLWKLQNFEQKKLLIDVIKLAIEEKAKTFFSYEDPYNNYKLAFSIVNEKYESSLAEMYIEYSNIEKELIDEDTLELDQNADVLFYLLKVSKNDEFGNKLVSEIKNLSEEQWKEAFVNDSFELSILDELSSRDYLIEVAKEYHDAFLSVIKVWIKGEDEPSDWQFERLQVFFDLMPPEFQEHFSVNLSKYIISSEFNISDKMEDFVLHYMDHKTMFIDGKHSIQDYVERSLKEKNVEGLIQITGILKQDNSGKFKSDKRMSKVLKDSFIELSENFEDNEESAHIKFLAGLFNIRIELLTKEEMEKDSSLGEDKS